jgi:hypothetical protein
MCLPQVPLQPLQPLQQGARKAWYFLNCGSGSVYLNLMVTRWRLFFLTVLGGAIGVTVGDSAANTTTNGLTCTVSVGGPGPAGALALLQRPASHSVWYGAPGASHLAGA